MPRSYWQIESGLHYRCGATLSEDQAFFKKHAAAQVRAIIINLTLGLIADTEFLFVPTAGRSYAVHPNEALDLLL